MTRGGDMEVAPYFYTKAIQASELLINKNKMLTASTVVIGVASSVLAELLKLFPALRTNSIVTSGLTMVLILIGTFLTEGKFTWEGLLGSLVVALTTYKAVVQPIAASAGLRTQK